MTFPPGFLLLLLLLSLLLLRGSQRCGFGTRHAGYAILCRLHNTSAVSISEST